MAYLAPVPAENRFALACLLTFTTQFAVGAARSYVTGQRWLTSGLEMRAVGAAAAGGAFAVGRGISSLVS